MSGRVNRSQFSLDSQNNHMFNSQLRKQFSQFHHQDAGSSSGSGSGNHKRVTPQSDLGSSSSSGRSRRRRRRRGTSQGSHLLPEAISRYAPQTYDAVWAIALALRAAEEHWRKDAAQSKLDGFDYTRSDMAWEFLQQLGKLHFLGVSVSGRRRGATKNREISRGIGLLSLLSLSFFLSLSACRVPSPLAVQIAWAPPHSIRSSAVYWNPSPSTTRPQMPWTSAARAVARSSGTVGRCPLRSVCSSCVWPPLLRWPSTP